MSAETSITSPGQPKPVNPWLFVPALYVMQAIPVTLVQDVSSIALKDMGLDNRAITFWSSLLALPWSIKLLWGPFVDLNYTKRGWMLATQALICAGLGGAALAMLGGQAALPIILVMFALTALFSATCDIATDGFYLLVLTKEQQANFVGIQSTSYRVGRLICSGGLVYLAGVIGKQPGSDATSATGWCIAFIVGAFIYAAGRLLAGYTAPKSEHDQPVLATKPERIANIYRTVSIISVVLSAYFILNSVTRFAANGAANALGSLPVLGDLKGWLLSPEQKGEEWAQLGAALVVFACSFIISKKFLKGTEMATAFNTFVRQKGFFAILAFMTFYRFGEVMVSRMVPLFLKDPVEKGGYALNNEQVGTIVGTFGVLGIIAGGIIGGIFVAKVGLKRGFWPVAISMHVPNLLYLYAAIAHPPVGALYPIAAIDQMGYGFGYSAYAVYLMQVASRTPEFKTSHYAIATALGATFISIAGISSGIIQSNYGYVTFFICVMVATIPGMLTLLVIPHEEKVPA